MGEVNSDANELTTIDTTIRIARTANIFWLRDILFTLGFYALRGQYRLTTLR